MTIAFVVFVVLALFLIYASTRPGTFRVERSVRIGAPAEQIFPLVDDFHNWASWSPFEKLDPNMKKTFSGAPGGKGAIYEWDGNSKAGKGRMEVLDSAPASRVLIKLDFLKPFEGHNTAEFTFEPQGDSTRARWAVYGSVPFVLKIMSVFVSLDSLMGKDFEAGLAKLKVVAEK